MHSTSNPKGISRLGFAAALFSLTLALAVLVGAASASRLNAPSLAPLPQATTAPQAVQTVQVPDAVATQANGLPAPVPTGDAGTGPNNTSNQPSDAPPAGQQNADGTVSTAATPSNSFPWWILLVGLVALIIIALAAVMMRSRRTTTAAATATGTVAPSAATSTTTATPASTVASTTTAAAPATAAAAPAAAATTAAVAAATPRTVTCPNCSTVNDWSENFCHECGQDLRPVRSAMIAAAAPPPDIVTDDMPYLETLDRTDEQLEYVLSRKRIQIGTAAGNDIVIDSSFRGSETVSPKHAELRREADGKSFMLVDLDSESGTFVNDVRTGENLLAEGDQVRLGNVRFIFRVP